MSDSTAKLVQQYVRDHETIRHCLERDLLKHLALARKISTEFNLSNKEEAICAALRRLVKRQRAKNRRQENRLQTLLSLPIKLTLRPSINEATAIQSGDSRTRFDDIVVQISLGTKQSNPGELMRSIIELLQHTGVAPRLILATTQTMSVVCGLQDLSRVIAAFDLDRQINPEPINLDPTNSDRPAEWPDEGAGLQIQRIPVAADVENAESRQTAKSPDLVPVARQ